MQNYTIQQQRTRARYRARVRRHRRKQIAALSLLAVTLLVSILIFRSHANNIQEATPLPASEALPMQPKTKEIPIDDWNLLLVNASHPLPDDYAVSLTQLDNGEFLDARCYAALQEMIDACRAAGLSPVICSAYRSREAQKALFQEKVEEYLLLGYSETLAQEEAERWIAPPQASEHQSGLALDIVDLRYQHLDEAQAETAVQKWLLENCWKYGFILRYPAHKAEITGIAYEPWHYRYVGKDAAKDIYAADLCLEEYLQQAAQTQ
jgi:D-alanyl-D-alanine carboxypeptidase